MATAQESGLNTETRVLGDALALRARRDDDAPFVKCGGDWLSAAQLNAAADRLASGLSSMGIGRGDRVAYIVPNRQEMIELFFACAKLGAINVTLNYWLRGEFLRYQIMDSQPKLLVADGPGVRAAAPIMEGAGLESVLALDGVEAGLPLKQITFDELERAGEGAVAPTVALTQRDPAAIIYTSGTTGVSKGCVLPHGYFTAAGTILGQFWMRPGDRILTASPLFHATGQSICLMMALMNDSSVCFEPAFSASGFMARAAEEQATVAFGVGPMGMAILNQPPSPTDTAHRLRVAIFPPMPPAAQDGFEHRFGVPVISEAYGQTECQPITLSALDGPRSRASCGRPMPHLEVKVVDDLDRVLGPGEVGEIVVRPREPDVMFSHYWANPEATVQASRNWWHHTGDFGRTDEQGFITFVDRKSDSMRRRGENVSSFELEAAIARHPKVAMCAAVAHPSSLGEDDIKVCLVCHPGEPPTPAELFEYFKTALPYYAIPRYVQLRDALPMTAATNRVTKHVLRAEGVTVDTWDLDALGFSVAKSERRG